MLMVDKSDDAIALWQQMVGEMQKGFRAFGNQLSAAPASRDASDHATPPGGAQTQLAELMESYFAGLNLPSRAQLNCLADRLQAIESELSDIKTLLREVLMNSKAADAGSLEPNSPSSQPRPKRPSAKSRRGTVPAGESEPLVPKDTSKPPR
jgi:hypothetical protein